MTLNMDELRVLEDVLEMAIMDFPEYDASVYLLERIQEEIVNRGGDGA